MRNGGVGEMAEPPLNPMIHSDPKGWVEYSQGQNWYLETVLFTEGAKCNLN